jgi:type II secretory pathway component GspD/PulD (secretin)
MNRIAKHILGAAIALILLSSASFADYYQHASDIAKKEGVISPAPGYSTGESNSRIDDYIHQDEQINLDPKSGTMRVLRTNQKINVNEFVPSLIGPIRNARVRELREIARAITALEGGSVEVVNDKEKKEYFLSVTCPTWQLPYLQSAIAALDKEWVRAAEDGTERATYQAKFRDIDSVNRIAAERSNNQISRSVIDPLNNSVTFSNDPGECKNYVEWANKADIPVSEVQLDAKVYEISDTNMTKIGFDFLAWKNGPGRNLFEFLYGTQNMNENLRRAGSIFNPLGPITPPADGSLGHWESNGSQVYGSYNAWVTAAYLDFLKTKGKAKLAATGTVRAISGNLGSWASATPIANLTVTGDMNKDLYNTGAGSRETVAGDGDSGDLGVWDRFLNYNHNGQAGFFLDVLPYVGRESTEMGIRVITADISGYTPAGLPMTSERSITSFVHVRDGETFVLAGLTREVKVTQKTGIPLLCDIPVLGYLFGSETTNDQKTHVVVKADVSVSTAGDSQIAMARKIQETVSQASGKSETEVPSNSLGFDQWLLDKE